LEQIQQKIEQIDKELKYFFTQTIVTKLSKIWVRDLGSKIRDPGYKIRDLRSGIWKKPIMDPGDEKAPNPGSGSATTLAKRD
jgi:hypothetical protein